jgi:hypothetical protein
MIGFNNLATMGRFGNQMFQYAALKGIAKNIGVDYTIPPITDRKIQHHNYGLFEAFKMTTNKNVEWLQTSDTFQEKQFHFDEEFFNSCPDEKNILGFFQTEKYFKNVEDDLRKDFTFRDEILIPCKEMIETLDREPIFLHVRRGDPTLSDRGFKWAYTECSSQHPPQPIEFDEDIPVIVFSDSPDWVKDQKIFSSDRFLISEPSDKYPDGSYIPYVDVCLMSLCSGAIIANSSLSWWGAWLQNNRGKVVAPKLWFGPAYADKITEDVYCEGWKVI